mmetsp:Transcript_119274/g.297546  ORF Transcript_119274/g.297546 Transcript_119274/m.297546 type:complete len:240 (-) Transcript_119274:588-1307(-)
MQKSLALLPCIRGHILGGLVQHILDNNHLVLRLAHVLVRSMVPGLLPSILRPSWGGVPGAASATALALARRCILVRRFRLEPHRSTALPVVSCPICRRGGSWRGGGAWCDARCLLLIALRDFLLLRLAFLLLVLFYIVLFHTLCILRWQTAHRSSTGRTGCRISGTAPASETFVVGSIRRLRLEAHAGRHFCGRLLIAASKLGIRSSPPRSPAAREARRHLNLDAQHSRSFNNTSLREH